MKKNIISMAAAMAVLSACGPGVPQLGKSSLDEVIGAMTLGRKGASGSGYRYGRLLG